MAGKTVKNWGSRREIKERKKEFIDNADETLKLIIPDLIEDLDLDGSFEGQVRTLKLLSDVVQFGKDLSDQMDDIQFELERLNRRLFKENNKKLLSEVQKN